MLLQTIAQTDNIEMWLNNLALGIQEDNVAVRVLLQPETYAAFF